VIRESLGLRRFRALVENWPEVMWAGLDSRRREARRTAERRPDHSSTASAVATRRAKSMRVSAG
jgi:hypothetical protein